MQLPRYTATTKPQGTGLVRATNIGALTNVGDAQFRAIEGAGRAIGSAADIGAKIKIQKQKISDDTQVDKISQDVTIWQDEQKKAFSEMLIETPEHQASALKTYTAGWNKLFADKLKDASPGVKRRMESIKASEYPRRYDRVRSISTGQFLKFATQQGADVAKGYASAGEIDLANQKVGQMYEDSVIGPAKKADLLDANTENYALGLADRGEYEKAHEAVKSSTLGMDAKRILDNKIDGIKGQKKDFEGKVYQKEVQDNASSILDSYIDGDMTNVEVHEENIGEFNQLIDKIANQATDIGDDYEYETIKEDLEAGKIVEEDELLNFAGILSREQLADATELNEQNKKMAGKRTLAKSVVGKINTRVRSIDSEIESQTGLTYNAEEGARLSSNLMAWRQEIVDESRKMIADGQSSTEVLTKINEAFDRTTENVLEGGWNQFWKPAKHDFLDFLETGVKDGKELTTEQLDKARRHAIVNLILAGEHDKIEAALDVGWLQ